MVSALIVDYYALYYTWLNNYRYIGLYGGFVMLCHCFVIALSWVNPFAVVAYRGFMTI
jgi:hypothetical protein